jgi:hypothetical protein
VLRRFVSREKTKNSLSHLSENPKSETMSKFKTQMTETEPRPVF